jgi:hypothetical protein
LFALLLYFPFLSFCFCFDGPPQLHCTHQSSASLSFLRSFLITTALHFLFLCYRGVTTPQAEAQEQASALTEAEADCFNFPFLVHLRKKKNSL